MRALLVPTSGPAQLVDVDVTLAWLQEQVDGLVERVPVQWTVIGSPTPPVDVCVWVNVEATSVGLPANPRATVLCRVATGGIRISGNAVVLGPPDGDADDTPVPESVVRFVRRAGWLPERGA